MSTTSSAFLAKRMAAALCAASRAEPGSCPGPVSAAGGAFVTGALVCGFTAAFLTALGAFGPTAGRAGFGAWFGAYFPELFTIPFTLPFTAPFAAEVLTPFASVAGAAFLTAFLATFWATLRAALAAGFTIAPAAVPATVRAAGLRTLPDADVLAAVAFFVAAVPALAGAFPAARLTPLVAVVAAPFPPPFTPGFTPRWAPAPPFPPSFADVVTPAF